MMEIKNHTITVSHSMFGDYDPEDISGTHEMTIRFNATIGKGGTASWVDDLIDAIGMLTVERTMFLSRPEVHAVRDEYRNIELMKSLNEEGK